MKPVYLYGMITPSTVHVLRDDFSYPRANTYAEIARTLPSIGGEAANSAIVLSKFGVKTVLDGNWIDPKNERKIKDTMSGYGIDISLLSVKEGFGTEEVVITDGRTRTVFGNYAAFGSGPVQWNTPSEEAARNASMVSIDPYFREESRLLARICTKHNLPYVTVDCRHDDYLAQNAESVIVSHELRDSTYGGRDMNEVFALFRENCKGLVVFTFGADELWYARPEGIVEKFTPYRVTPVDTTGAGDSFRAGIMYGLLEGLDDRRTIDFASAVAACVCLSAPHALNAPDLKGVLAFMKSHGERT